MTHISFTSRPVIGSETITVSTTPIGCTASALVKIVGDKTAAGSVEQTAVIRAKSAYFSVEDQEMRISFNPAVTVAAGSNGHEFAAGSSFTVDGVASLADLRMIRTGGADSVVRVTYYG